MKPDLPKYTSKIPILVKQKCVEVIGLKHFSEIGNIYVFRSMGLDTDVVEHVLILFSKFVENMLS